MLLSIWIAATIVEILLFLVLLRRDILPWFTLWTGVMIGQNVICLFSRDFGSFYDPFWRISEIFLIFLLCMATAESAKDLDAPHARASLALAGIAGALIHLWLKASIHWPHSWLEGVFVAAAVSELIMGFFLLQVRARGAGVYRRHSAVLIGYLLATATCYYVAADFSHTIGRAVEGIELVCGVLWLWCFRPQKTH